MTDEKAIVKIGEHQRAIVESAQKTLFADFDSDLTEALGLAIGALKERKTGKWVNDEHDIPHCSCCQYIPAYDTAICDIYYSKYCPECGAKMEVDDGDSN